MVENDRDDRGEHSLVRLFHVIKVVLIELLRRAHSPGGGENQVLLVDIVESTLLEDPFIVCATPESSHLLDRPLQGSVSNKLGKSVFVVMVSRGR